MIKITRNDSSIKYATAQKTEQRKNPEAQNTATGVGNIQTELLKITLKFYMQ